MAAACRVLVARNCDGGVVVRRGWQPAAVIPGHSKVGAPIDATSAVNFTERYLLTFDEELKKAKEPDDLIKAMQQKFPSADLLLAIERGAKANVKHQ